MYFKVFFRNVETGKLGYVGHIYADSLDETYVRTQNKDSNWWTMRGYVSIREENTEFTSRSSSVGDVFLNEADEAFIVAPSGFLRFPPMDEGKPENITVDTFNLVWGHNEC